MQQIHFNFNSFPMPCFFLALPNTILETNKAFKSYFGSEAKRLIDIFDTSSLSDFFTVNSKLNIGEDSKEIILNEKGESKSGHSISISWVALTERTNSTKFRVLLYKRPIQTSQKDKKQLPLPKKRTDKFFESLPLNSYRVERFGKYEVIKDNDHLIFKNGELKNNFWKDLDEKIADDAWQLFRKVLKTEKTQYKEVVLLKNDEEIWLNLSFSWSAEYFFFTYTNITQEKQSAEKMIHLDRANTANILAGGVAHQYNNLHHSIISLIYQAKELKGSKQKETLNSAIALLSSGAELSRSLLSKLRDVNAKNKVTKLNDLFTRIRLLTHDEAIKHNCLLEIPQSDLFVLGNPTHLDQVFVNLIMNAIQACCDNESSKRVNLKLIEKDKHKITIEVHDNGHGIEKKNMDKLFTPLFSTKGVYARKHSKSSSINATGLGLSVARKLIEEVDGELELKQSNKNGSTFAVTLNRTHTGEIGNTPSDLLSEEAYTAPQKKYKIYVADDSKENRNVLKIYLRNNTSELKEATNGYIDEEIFKAFAPDIIFLDWLMPEYGGEDFLCYLDERAQLKPYMSKTIIFTGLELNPQIEKWAPKVKAIMQKPIDHKKLLSTLGEFYA